ncbi:hypothetical protein GCM10023331_03710 [Algivirga pacifica]|uniref:histidine kinase n=1 Tax=Algivirga pacifica TaxID=1162670 RepID=A0ABP9D057_9BACT
MADSVWNILESLPEKDTTYAYEYNAYVKAYQSINLDSMMLLAKNSLALSKSLDYPKGYGVAYERIGMVHYNRGEYEEAAVYFDSSHVIHSAIRDSVGAVSSLGNVAFCYDRLGMYELSLKYFQQVADSFLVMNDTVRLQLSYKCISNSYQHLGKLDSATKYLLMGLRLAEAKPDRISVAGTYSDIGKIYFSRKEYAKAKVYFEKALTLRQRDGDDFGVGRSHLNLSKVFRVKKQYNESLMEIDKALVFSTENGFTDMEADAIREKALTYLVMGELRKSEQFFKKAEQIFMQTEGHRELVELQNKMGTLYLKYQQWDRAKAYFDKSMQKAQKGGMKEWEMKNYKGLYEVTLALEQHQQALAYYEKYIQLKDEIVSLEKEKQIRQLQIQYETEKKEQQIKQQGNQLEIAKAEIEREQLLNQAFLVISILMLVVGAVSFYAYRQNKKARKKIEEQHNKLEELSTFKENMTSMIVHDLKNPLSTIINLVNYSPVDGRRIKQEGQRMFNLVMNILDVRKFEEASVQPTLEEVSLGDILEDSRQQVRMLQEDKSIVLQLPTTPITVKVDRYMVERVFVNLLTNAIKFSPLGGSIYLKYHITEEGWVQVSVKDEGVGIPKEDQELVFSLYGQTAAKNVSTSTGLGLSYCKSTIEAHGGQIGIHSEENKGTEVFLTLPLVAVEEVDGSQEVEVIEAIGTCTLEILDTYKEQLRAIPAYHYSEVTEVIAPLKETEEEVIKEWIEAVEMASLTGNQEQYDLLSS